MLSEPAGAIATTWLIYVGPAIVVLLLAFRLAVIDRFISGIVFPTLSIENGANGKARSCTVRHRILTRDVLAAVPESPYWHWVVAAPLIALTWLVVDSLIESPRFFVIQLCFTTVFLFPVHSLTATIQGLAPQDARFLLALCVGSYAVAVGALLLPPSWLSLDLDGAAAALRSALSQTLAENQKLIAEDAANMVVDSMTPYAVAALVAAWAACAAVAFAAVGIETGRLHTVATSLARGSASGRSALDSALQDDAPGAVNLGLNMDIQSSRTARDAAVTAASFVAPPLLLAAAWSPYVVPWIVPRTLLRPGSVGDSILAHQCVAPGSPGELATMTSAAQIGAAVLLILLRSSSVRSLVRASVASPANDVQLVGIVTEEDVSRVNSRAVDALSNLKHNAERLFSPPMIALCCVMALLRSGAIEVLYERSIISPAVAHFASFALFWSTLATTIGQSLGAKLASQRHKALVMRGINMRAAEEHSVSKTAKRRRKKG